MIGFVNFKIVKMVLRYYLLAGSLRGELFIGVNSQSDLSLTRVTNDQFMLCKNSVMYYSPLSETTDILLQ